MSRDVYLRRRAVALGVLALLVVALVLLLRGGGHEPPSNPPRAAAARPPLPELPRGRRTIFPHFRVVAFYGAPQAAQLGTLGIGTPDAMAKRLERQARPYRVAGRPVLPAMELLADIANPTPGDDGMYRTQQPDAIIARYLAAARRARALLVLDIQPGHADFFTEARRLERWLREPDVSLALDPEWHTPGAIPGQVIGSIDAREVNAISYWLEGIVRRHRLPQKLLVVHRFTPDMIRDEQLLKPRREVAVTINVDGFGSNVVKVAKYESFAKSRASGLHNGLKLFYHEDVQTMTPGQAMAIHPRPELIVYE